MPRYYRHQRRYARPWHSIHSAIWLIGLGLLFLWGHIWPGILLLIGLSMILETVLRGAEPDVPPVPPSPATFTPPVAPVVSTPAPVHRTDLLPRACPRCGGPVRAYEVQWTGEHSPPAPTAGRI